MFSFDKLVLFVVSLVCIACAMYLGMQKEPATAGATMLMGSLVTFLGAAQAFLFSVLKAEARAQSQPSAPQIVVPQSPVVTSQAPVSTGPETPAQP